MANPTTLQVDTTLYSVLEPGGRLFLAGESWPGDAWSMKPGGEASGANAAAGALKDLTEAYDRLEQLGQVTASQAHDLAVIGAERDEAVGRLGDAEQRAIAAEKAAADAAEASTGYMRERDEARAAAEKAAADRDAAHELMGESTATIERLTRELETSSQAVADLTERLNAPSKPAKAAKPADAEAEKAADGDKAAPAPDAASDTSKPS